MARRALDDEPLLRHAGDLRVVRDRVIFGVDRDHRMSGAIASAEAGRESGNAALDLEAGGGERVLEQLGAFEFLHAELAEIEDAVAEERNRARVAVDIIEQEFLLRREVAFAVHSQMGPAQAAAAAAVEAPRCLR